MTIDRLVELQYFLIFQVVDAATNIQHWEILKKETGQPRIMAIYLQMICIFRAASVGLYLYQLKIIIS